MEKVEIDDETRKELEKAPQVNERPGPLDLPQLAPEKLLPIHLTTDLLDDARNETKSEPKSKVWLYKVHLLGHIRHDIPNIQVYVQTLYTNKKRAT